MSTTTESSSNYVGLDQMSTHELLTNINNEDKLVATAIEKIIPKLEIFIEKLVERYQKGGRLFYLGAGTSGRLGVLDASEIPPTYGVKDRIIGLIAGGDFALRNAVENAEDDTKQAWIDMMKYSPNENDTLLGIAASGRTPYVIEGIQQANKSGLLTACITCNLGSKLAQVSQHPLEAEVGPEFVTGSTRMKSGTAQKLLLNMISTALMIRVGRVKGNKMVHMQLTNEKLVNRGTKMIMEELSIAYKTAHKLLIEYGSVQKAVENFKANV